MSRNIIAFSGHIGAGKSTSAAILGEQYGYVRMSFADPLYAVTGNLGFARQPVGGQDRKAAMDVRYFHDFEQALMDALLEGLVLSEQDHAEVYGRLLEALDDRLSKEGGLDTLSISHRELLIAVGEAVKLVRPGYFADRVYWRILATDSDVVIDDARFDDEAIMVNGLGGSVLSISRSLDDVSAHIHNVGTVADLHAYLTAIIGKDEDNVQSS